MSELLIGEEVNSEYPDIADELYVRAAAYGAELALTHEESPVAGDFLFVDTMPNEEDTILSVLGKRLGEVKTLTTKKEHLAQLPMSLGALASRASISATTGCWSVLQEMHPQRGPVPVWRDDKGYAFTWNPESYGYSVDRSGGFRGIQLHRMAYNMKRRGQGLPDLNQYQHLDHECRWTGCCNIDHLEITSRERNNKLRDQARRFESAIVAGQIILGPMGIAEIDERLLASETEYTSVVIATVAGPHRLVKIDQDPLLFRAEKEHCELVQSVAPPAPTKYERPSRAKRAKVKEETPDSPEGQRLLFGNTGYDGKRPNRSKLYRNWQKTGLF
jgi:hypothetical protein